MIIGARFRSRPDVAYDMIRELESATPPSKDPVAAYLNAVDALRLLALPDWRAIGDGSKSTFSSRLRHLSIDDPGAIEKLEYGLQLLHRAYDRVKPDDSAARLSLVVKIGEILGLLKRDVEIVNSSFQSDPRCDPLTRFLARCQACNSLLNLGRATEASALARELIAHAETTLPAYWQPMIGATHLYLAEALAQQGTPLGEVAEHVSIAAQTRRNGWCRYHVLQMLVAARPKVVEALMRAHGLYLGSDGFAIEAEAVDSAK